MEKSVLAGLTGVFIPYESSRVFPIGANLGKVLQINYIFEVLT
jgi:hypothetical protein